LAREADSWKEIVSSYRGAGGGPRGPGGGGTPGATPPVSRLLPPTQSATGPSAGLIPPTGSQVTSPAPR